MSTEAANIPEGSNEEKKLEKLTKQMNKAELKEDSQTNQIEARTTAPSETRPPLPIEDASSATDESSERSEANPRMDSFPLKYYVIAIITIFFVLIICPFLAQTWLSGGGKTSKSGAEKENGNDKPTTTDETYQPQN